MRQWNSLRIVLHRLFNSEKELRDFWREEGIDDEEMGDASDALEVFVLPDGRYLYVEG